MQAVLTRSDCLKKIDPQSIVYLLNSPIYTARKSTNVFLWKETQDADISQELSSFLLASTLEELS